MTFPFFHNTSPFILEHYQHKNIIVSAILKQQQQQKFAPDFTSFPSYYSPLFPFVGQLLKS